MSVVSIDKIIPRHSGRVDVEGLTLGNGSILAKYNRLPFQSTAVGPFSDNNDNLSNAVTGVVTILGDQVTLFMNAYTFEATLTAFGPHEPLTLVTPITSIVAENLTPPTSHGASCVFMGETDATNWQLVNCSVAGTGVVTFTPSYPISTGGFSTTDGTVTFPACSVTWQTNLPVYVA